MAIRYVYIFFLFLLVMQSFTLYFKNLRNEHITKDVGYVPAFMGRFYDSEIATKSKDINFSNLRFNPVSVVSINSFFKYLLKKKPSVLMLFHINRHTFFNVILAMLLLPNIKIYVKSDYGPSQVRHIEQMSFFRKKIHLFKINLLLSLINILTVEDVFVYRFMKKNLGFKQKIHHIPNGFSPTLVTQKKNKLNQIITVSNFNDPKKRTLDLLKLISEMKSDLKAWKVVFVGKNDLIIKQANDFINKNKLSNLVRFTGPILDRNKLNLLYAQSKIFILYSVREGFPLVLTEAGFFGNVIVSTDEGGSRDVTQDGLYGGLCASNDPECIKNKIRFYIKNPEKLKKDQEATREHIRKNFDWNLLTKKSYFLLN